MAQKRTLQSERVVTAAPLSFAGALGRTRRLYRDLTGWVSNPFVAVPMKILAWSAMGVLLLIWWAFIVVWYFLWGLWLVPYRLIRRGSRKEKREDARHRELLAAVEKGKSTD